MTLGPREVRQLLASHQLEPRRSRGQHFVADANTVRRIARLAGVGPGDRVVEVGAGLGSLTLALAETGAEVRAVEVDHRLVPVLRSVVEPVGVTVVEGDAMRLDWDELLGAGPDTAKSWHLVANLPYNVATPLVADLLDGVPAIGRMLVMVQREVGERLAAGVGDAAYGGVSVKVGYWATAEVVGRVPATVFVPPPKVESVLVRITRRETPGAGEHVDWESLDRRWLFRLVQAGFGQRRKMLRRSLAGLVPAEAFTCAGVRPEARAEELDVEAWGKTGRMHAATGRDVAPDHRRGERAPAKLTLSLRIVGVREDGYHLIDAEMVTLDLADVLTFGPGDGLEVVGPFAEGVPAGAPNLVLRALAVTGRRARVRLEKHVASGAGLGGGSADAAAVLRWAGCDDAGSAASIGADVPFCLVGGRAQVTGIGEVVRPLPFEPRTFTLLVPPMRVATAAVYKVWDEMGGPEGAGGNDLEPAALAVSPELAHWRDRLGDATGLSPRLAGSGSTWFVEGEFPGEGRIVTRATES